MSRTRAYVGTLNNWTPEEEEELKKVNFQYCVIGREVGEGGTPHLQMYFYFKNTRTLSSLKKINPRIHWEVRRGTHEQARDYCMKDGNFWELGIEPEKNGGDKVAERIAKNKRLRDGDLYQLVDEGELNILDVKRLKQARDILANCGHAIVTEDVRGIWIYGPPGTGKTHAARTEYGNPFYIKPQNKWFDGYQGEKVIVLDDLDKQGSCLGHYLKIWADKWACSGEVKGGTVPLMHEKFIVTSNYLPFQIWPEDDEMVQAINRRFEMRHHLIKYT